MRETRQRKVILNVLHEAKDHPSADLIYDRVRKVLPKISLGTVYRNLEVLVKRGDILCLASANQNRYDGDTSEHLHFRCISCGGFEDMNHTGNMSDSGKSVQHVDAGKKTVFGVYIEYFGLCEQCSREKR